MIGILLKDPIFEQDIRELLMAFYPGELFGYERQTEIKFYVKGSFNRAGTLYYLELEDAEESANENASPNWQNNNLTDPIKFDRLKHLESKNRIKRRLYQMLSAKTGKTLPWGTLTGIRPVKLVTGMLEEGKTRKQVGQYIKETYLISDKKLDLLLDTAEHEKVIMHGIACDQGYSLYIGIPFCPTTCLYCSFTSYPIGKWAVRTREYLETLLVEMKYVSQRMGHQRLDTIYIGGGTPTSLSSEDLEWLLDQVITTFDVSHLREFTVEAGRPDSITAEKLVVMKKFGVNRISINPQTMKQETLDLIGRHHTVEMIHDCFMMARNIGFDNINMDLIVGLPNETIEDVKCTMEAVQQLAPDSITIHSLAIKRAAKLNMDKEQYADIEIVNTQEIIDLTANYAARMGMKPYYLYRQKNMAGNFENVGYTKENKACLYNVLIMEEKQTILACGAGTSTKVVYHEENRLERAENVKDIQIYMDRIDEMIERKEKLLAKL